MKSRIIYSISLILLIVSCTSKIDFIPVSSQSSDLLISEVSTAINTDVNAGSKRNHYIELYNGTGASIDLSDYAIGYQAVSDSITVSPWNFTDPANYFILTTTIQTGKCYVIASPTADNSIISKSDITWGTTSTSASDASKPLQLSGNSAIALLKKDPNGSHVLNGSNYKIIDVFGSPQVIRESFYGSSSRNNYAWGIAGELDTRNRTFKRKGTITSPNIDWNSSRGTTSTNSEWLVSADRGWDYGNLSFPTIIPPTIPTITTGVLTQITDTSATGGGNVINDGGQAVTERGICWSTSPNPDITSPTKTSDGAGTGTFISNISGLLSNTTYYVRAYATNIIGTAYGTEVQFSTSIVNADLLISEISTAINTDSILVAGAVRARNHYVELYNGTNSSINLSDYAIGYQAVSDTTTLSAWDFTNAANYLILSGNINTRSCYVILSNGADQVNIPHQTTWGTSSILTANASKPLQLSGNSAIALLKKSTAGTHTLGGNTYAIIDVFGSPLVPRSTATGASSVRNNFIWTTGGVTDTRNNTFKRKSTVINPTTDWNLSKGTDSNNSQWLISSYRLWDYSNVGLPTP